VPAAHTTELQNARDATCTEPGYTGDEVCTVCGETVTPGETIPATGHTAGAAVKENEVAATCATDGSYDSVIYCSVCGEEINRETVTVTATGHTTEIQNARDATCTTDGYTGDEVCSVCGETITTGEIIPATGHSYKAVIIEATYTTQGCTRYTCTVCGHSYDTDYTAVKVIDETGESLKTQTTVQEQTDTTTESTDTSGTSAGSTTSAQTGDNSQMVLWLVLLLLSGVGAAGIAINNTKQKRSR
ncbi:MAG: hypothetical protein LUF78_13995, partial [Clostridiales bacterium]|nr:hypothetical protein [Clostridiales bacterium]